MLRLQPGRCDRTGVITQKHELLIHMLNLVGTVILAAHPLLITTPILVLE